MGHNHKDCKNQTGKTGSQNDGPDLLRSCQKSLVENCPVPCGICHPFGLLRSGQHGVSHGKFPNDTHDTMDLPDVGHVQIFQPAMFDYGTASLSM